MAMGRTPTGHSAEEGRMQDVTYITPMFAVTGELVPDDFAEIAKLGFKCVISNRPDDEETTQMLARAEAATAWRHGLKFVHVPAAKLDLFTNAVVEDMADALRSIEGPVLAHCKSGLRSAIVWAAASARNQPVDCVLAALKKAGFDLEFIRDDLERQADLRRWLGKAAPALDCGTAVDLDRAAA